MVANPARGQMNRENIFFTRLRLKSWSRDTGSVVPSHVSPLILHTQAESVWQEMTGGVFKVIAKPKGVRAGQIGPFSPLSSGRRVMLPLRCSLRCVPSVKRYHLCSPYGRKPLAW